MLLKVRNGLALLSMVAAATHVAVATGQAPVNPQAAALKDFSDRTHAYLDLRDRTAAQLPKKTGRPSAEALSEHRDELAVAIRQARRGAHEGDIFTPEVSQQFKAIIRKDLKSRDFRDAIAAVEEVPYQSVWVNMGWPPEAPRPTIPARILTSLYPLPEGLEYRLLDRHLVLLDLDAQLIVDLVRDVLPSSIRPRIKR